MMTGSFFQAGGKRRTRPPLTAYFRILAGTLTGESGLMNSGDLLWRLRLILSALSAVIIDAKVNVMICSDNNLHFN